MSRTGWRLSKLISRLGIKGGQEFDLIPAVQPTLSVGSAGGLMYPLNAPNGITGGPIFVGAGENGKIALHAVADGGAIVRELQMWTHNTVSGNHLAVWVTDSPPAEWLTLNARTWNGQSDRLPQARLSSGSNVGAESVADKFLVMPLDANNPISSLKGFHIPQGHWLLVQHTASISMDYGIWVEDVTASPPLE